MDGKVASGINALYRNVLGYPAPYEKNTICTTALPMTMGGQQVTFYTVVVQAGKMPPVSSPSRLTPNTLYVIMIDKRTVTVAY